MSNKFIKNKEDFACENCGFFVVGDGFTNHCPQCLWSKHVDINPGDRMSECGGMMKPVGLRILNREQKLTHECILCGYRKINRLSKDDNYDKVIAVTKESVK